MTIYSKRIFKSSEWRRSEWRMVRGCEWRRSDADNEPRCGSHVSDFKEGGERGRGLDILWL